jgi:DNA-directed RNA polymerase alpha subunit
MGDFCKTVTIKAEIQENGIIRIANNGIYIGRLDGIKFDEIIEHRLTVEELDLSVRAYNVLKRYGINFADEVESMSYEQITNIRGMGRKVLEEIEEKLGKEFK